MAGVLAPPTSSTRTFYKSTSLCLTLDLDQLLLVAEPNLGGFGGGGGGGEGGALKLRRSQEL